MSNKTFLYGDLLFMNVSWASGDLHLYENQSGFAVAIIYTAINSLILLMAFIVHKAVYKLLARLPDRAINHIIKPSMVSINKILILVIVIEIDSDSILYFSGFTLCIYWSQFGVLYTSLLGVSYERLCWRNWLSHNVFS